MILMKNISKEYRLGEIGYGTLNRDLQSWWARVRHKPDPNARLGKEKRLDGDMLLALDEINLSVYQGECVGIIGGNGAGKSTLLKLISRVAAPTSGSMDLYGRVTSMLEVGTGFHGEMTGRENIYLNGTILGMSRSEIDDKLEAIIDFSEVRDFIDTPVKRYSSGMYVKLAFSVASHLTSEIVIMDEVLAVGDAAFQKKCIEKMRSAAEDENRTVLYVSHNMDTVRRLCDRCIVLSAGRIVYDGETEEAIRYYNSSLLSANETAGRLSDIVRRGRDLSGICKIEALEIVSATVSGEEPVRFNMRLHSREDLSNVFLRLVLSNNYGQILGMTATSPFEIKKGDAFCSFSFPVSELAPGGYTCDFAVLSFDGSLQVRHDFLSKVMSFEVAETQRFFGSNWRIRNWGSIKLSPIDVSRIEPAALHDEKSVWVSPGQSGPTYPDDSPGA